MSSTHAETHNLYKLEIINIFTVAREVSIFYTLILSLVIYFSKHKVMKVRVHRIPNLLHIELQISNTFYEN